MRPMFDPEELNRRYEELMRQNGEWIRDHSQPYSPMTPRSVQRDAQTQFGRTLDQHDRPTFYASWEAYDAAVANMPLSQQSLQKHAETLELERLFRL